MQGYIKRNIEDTLLKDLKHFPAVALLGPRQCGKSTLALNLKHKLENFLYLDLESFADLRKLEDPELFFSSNKDKLICLDEIQNSPDLFPVLRSIIDRSRRNGQILLLGSASRDLIKQSSESLAGRICYLELTPFLQSEICAGNEENVKKIWVRGGYPNSYLAVDNEYSRKWRDNFIRTYLERDIPQLGFNIPANRMRRLWMMCAHNHGQILNSSKLSESLGVTYHTVRSHLNLLEQTFLIRILPPFHTNLKKRLVKSPKIFIRDSGILHTLLDIANFNDLLGHPVFGASWEGFAMEHILAEFPGWRASYYRTSAGAEIDLILEKGQQRVAIEFKASTAPKVAKGFWSSLKDLNISKAWIIAPVDSVYPIKKNVFISPLDKFVVDFREEYN